MSRFTKKTDTETLTVDAVLPIEQVQLRAEGWTEETSEELEARTVPELKAELASAGLPTEGKKADLVTRLSGEKNTDKS